MWCNGKHSSKSENLKKNEIGKWPYFKVETSHSLWDSSPPWWDGGVPSRSHVARELDDTWQWDHTATADNKTENHHVNPGCGSAFNWMQQTYPVLFFWTMRLVSRWKIWIISPLNSQMTGMDENSLRFHVSFQCCILSPFYDHSGSGWVLPPHLFKLTVFKFPKFSSSFIM